MKHRMDTSLVFMGEISVVPVIDLRTTLSFILWL